MYKDLISIIVPVYKVEQYLDTCIQSIVNQTYTNIEIILVDDGSPDQCPSICDYWAAKDKRIRVIHQENGGLSAARNTGIDDAKGDYLMFIDSDDYIAPTMAEALYQRIVEDQSDLALCNFLYVDAKQQEISASNMNLPIKDEILIREQSYNKLFSDRPCYYVVAWNKLYTRKIFDQLRYPKGKAHEDEFLIHQIFDQCEKISCCSQALYYYVQHENSIMSSTYSYQRLDAVEAILERSAFFLKKGRAELSSSCILVLYYHLQRGYVYLDTNNKKNITRLSELRTSFEYAFLTLYRSNLNFKHKFYIRVFLLHPKLFSKLAKKIRPYLKKILLVIQLQKLRTLFSCLYRVKKRIAAGKGMQNCFLIATPCHGNLGDHAIVFAEKLLAEHSHLNLIEITNDEYKNYKKILQRYVKSQDIVAIDGGGNLGTLWPWEDDKISEIIDTYKNNRLIIFPQTSYYSNTPEGEARLASNQRIYAKAKNLTLCLRDQASYDFCCKNFTTTNCIYTPDIVLYINQQQNITKRENCLLCLRADCESVLKYDDRRCIEDKLNAEALEFSYTDTVIPRGVSIHTRNQELQQKWAEFASSKLVITDRLHGMIFAAITGTPCLALDNLSKKVSGVHQWIQHLPYIRVCHSIDELVEHIDKYAKMGQQKYDASSIQAQFHKLLTSIKDD